MLLGTGLMTAQAQTVGVQGTYSFEEVEVTADARA
jgi:hypothetical protein